MSSSFWFLGIMKKRVPTVAEWLGILETTGEIILVPPFHENFGKRLIKSPKVYFVDSGLACHFRDQQGLEVDFLVPLGGARLALLEAKASATVLPRMDESLLRLARAVKRYDVQSAVIYRRATGAHGSAALLPGVSALAVADLPKLLQSAKTKRTRT